MAHSQLNREIVISATACFSLGLLFLFLGCFLCISRQLYVRVRIEVFDSVRTHLTSPFLYLLSLSRPTSFLSFIYLCTQFTNKILTSCECSENFFNVKSALRASIDVLTADTPCKLICFKRKSWNQEIKFSAKFKIEEPVYQRGGKQFNIE